MTPLPASSGALEIAASTGVSVASRTERGGPETCVRCIPRVTHEKREMTLTLAADRSRQNCQVVFDLTYVLYTLWMLVTPNPSPLNTNSAFWIVTGLTHKILRPFLLTMINLRVFGR
jgi:hypothetical protein